MNIIHASQYDNLTSKKAGTAGIPLHPSFFETSRTFSGVGTTGDKGACGVYRPIGKPVTRGAYTCVNIPIV